MSKKFLETPDWFKVLWDEFLKTHVAFENITGYNRQWWKDASEKTRKELLAKMSDEDLKKMNAITSYGNSIKDYAFRKYKYENAELVGDHDIIGMDDETGKLYVEEGLFQGITKMVGEIVQNLREKYGIHVHGEVIKRKD